MSKSAELNSPLVSVIIPTYNRPAYLKEALQSAVQQTYHNLEIIVSDNCSAENPQPIVESFRDPRIRFYRNPTNLGMFANTMSAFGKARGKYVASLLDDDRWKPDFLAKLVPPLEEHPEAVLAFCDHFAIDAAGNINWQATEELSQAYRRKNLQAGIYQPFKKNWIVDGSVSSSMAALIRREFILWQEIPAEVGVAWDMYLTYLCSRSNLGAYYCSERLTCVRIHSGSETYNDKQDFEAKIQKMKSHVFCYEQFMKDENLSEFKPIFQRKWAFYNTAISINLLRVNQPIAARQYALASLGQNFSLRSLVTLMLSYMPSSFVSQF